MTALWHAQGGLCWICKKPLALADAHKDHDHGRADKHIRSLLHTHCNKLEGTVDKNPKKVGRILRLHAGEEAWPKP